MPRSSAQEVSIPPSAPRAAGAWPPEPYLGINFYTAADAPLFGEREADIEQCTALVGEFSTRLLVLQGKSGTGKSSFLRAGLIPRLEQEGSPFYFLRSEIDSVEPTFVRCTNDPVGRILALLGSALANDPQLAALPIGFRQAVGELLGAATSQDRVETAAGILKILSVLSEAMPQTLVLVIDQSEEILTLQPASDPNNQRNAFFYLLEELCLRNLDVRIIIAIRTEFCGRFYDAFGINPTLRITSGVRAGLEQFMLDALPRDGLVSAILRPTLPTPIEGYGIPRERYRFKYGEGVAEHIADDLIAHCGDASALPVLQIVCKDLHHQVVIEQKCPKITIAHYHKLGGVKGRIDAYIDGVLRGALRETGASSVTPAELIRWRRVLATLAARQEGNAVTTLIRDEHDIVTEAGRQELRGDIPKILKTLAKHRWRLLRHVVGSTNGAALQYSLGHDALAVALLKWDEAQHSLEEAEQVRLKARRKLQTYALAFICVLLAVAGMHAWKDFSSSDERSRRLAEFSNVDDARNFRLRVQLLSAALAISQGRWSWFISGQDAREKLESALSLSPVQSGSGDTIGLSDDGARIAVLNGQTIREFEVGSGSEIQSSAYTLPPDPIPLSNFPSFAAIGFVANSQAPVLYKGGYLYRRGMAPIQIRDLYPQSFDKADNPKFVPVDFVQGVVQAILPDRFDDTENWIEVLRALPPDENPTARGLSQHIAAKIAWYGPQSWPVLSTRSDNVAYIGKPRDKDIYAGIVLTSLSNPTFTTLLHAFPKDPPSDFDSYISMVFADSGNALVVRDSQKTLRIFSTARDLRSRLLLRERPPPPVIQIPDLLQGRVLPRRPSMRPLLAAAKVGSEWRLAWLTPDGVAAITTNLSVPNSVAALSDSELLTGPVDLENAHRLSFSPDGRYLTLVLRPRMPTKADRREPMRYLVWDLNHSKRGLAKFSDEQLQDEACKVARLDRTIDAKNMKSLLTEAEEFTWFDGWVAPCRQQSQGLDVN